MKYCFTTLAIGEEYERNALKLFKDLKNKTTNCDFFLATNNVECKDFEDDRIKINIIDPIKTVDSRPGFNFNVNLKCLALKSSLTHVKNDHTLLPYDFIFYIDGDWSVMESFDESKIKNIFNYMVNESKDFVFERPALVKESRLDPENSFFREKIYDYDILEYTGWDNAHVCNEQLLLFKNNYKFKFFVQRWEQFLWYTIQNDIRNYAEGFEIGISALEAGMEYNWGAFQAFLGSCFSFYTKEGVWHGRF